MSQNQRSEYGSSSAIVEGLGPFEGNGPFRMSCIVTTSSWLFSSERLDGSDCNLLSMLSHTNIDDTVLLALDIVGMCGFMVRGWLSVFDQ
jgi:hypothetical protein